VKRTSQVKLYGIEELNKRVNTGEKLMLYACGQNVVAFKGF
jgi:hypothetical protein